MQPIVDGLDEEFNEEMTFVYLDARDGADGQQAFEDLSLPGHPSILIFDAEGTETYRVFGIVEEATLRDQIAQVLN